MMKKFKDAMSARMAALRADENGMEAAQVILILAIVVVVLIPVITLIVNALKSQGTKVVSGINGIQ
jgi:Flp pilus assembly pilin Flp